MTSNRSFKRLVRSRMDRTGESYTTARTALLAAAAEPTGAEPAPLATSDAEIRRRTGRGWEEWFDLLDRWGVAELDHRAIACRVAAELGIEPLVWEAQAVTGSYERARRGRAVGQRADGFAVTVSKTVPVPADEVYDLIVDEARRATWLSDAPLTERAATRPRWARYDWSDDGTRVHITLDAKGEAKTTVTVEHSRLPDADGRDRMRTFWRDALATLTSTVVSR